MRATASPAITRTGRTRICEWRGDRVDRGGIPDTEYRIQHTDSAVALSQLVLVGPLISAEIQGGADDTRLTMGEDAIAPGNQRSSVVSGTSKANSWAQ